MSSEDYTTRPTLETILERINAVAQELHAFRAETAKALTAVDVRLDRIESLAYTTRGEMLAMRADFIELRDEFREFRSHFKEPA